MPTSQVFKYLPNVHHAYFQTSPAVSLLVRITWKPYIPQAVSCDALHLWQLDTPRENTLGEQQCYSKLRFGPLRC